MEEETNKIFDSDFISQTTNRRNLLQLLFLRLIAIIGQAGTILVAYYFLEISLPLGLMFSVIGALGLLSIFSFYLYESQKNISDKRLFIELLLDVVALTLQFYFSGGISNPFIALFLLQVIISAVLLSAFYSWLIGIITIFCYVGLSFNYQELHEFNHHAGHADSFGLHLQGMLISYVFAAVLLLIFVTKIIKNLKERDKQISQLKQQSLEKEQLIKMGLFATSAAHELSTPLSTIAVVLSDWKKMNFAKDVDEDIQLLDLQVRRCKKILSEILSSSGKIRLENAQKVSVQEAFDDLIKEWSELRLPQNLNYKFVKKSDKKIILSSDLKLAFFNVFDNALEESFELVEILVEESDHDLRVIVKDQGRGFSEEVLRNIGKPNFTTKNDSNGLGLFLAINSFARFGGNLKASNKKNGGAEIEIKIPLKNL